MFRIRIVAMLIMATFIMTGFQTLPSSSLAETGKVNGLGLSEKDVIDAYIYILGRYLVIRQKHVDLSEEGVDYNVIKFNELGKAEFVNPNLDVAYLEAWFAVDEKTPVILEIPRIEGRYYTAQIMDEWAEILYNINQRNFPDHPYGRFALCLKGSNPEIPADTLRIDLPSRKAKMLARVERKGDDKGALKLQRSFRIIQTGKPVVEEAVSIPMFTNRELVGVEAFDKPMVTNVLNSAPDLMSVSSAFHAKVLAIADFIAATESNRAVIEAIIREKGIPHLLALCSGEVRGDNRNGWSSTREWLNFGDDVEFRTAANYSGIWWNSSAEVVYYMGMKDKDGKPLQGDSSYTIHYGPEDLPENHVDAYWSLTLMSLPDYRVVPNSLDRYNLNNVSDVTFGQDGSLTLYIAAKLPEEAPKGNWLPSPRGKSFVLNHRFYVPKQEVLSGQWYVPPIIKMD